MKTVLLVALGGSLGALSRWGLAAWVDKWREGGSGQFPLGILVANILGCYLFGWLLGLSEQRQLFPDAVKLGIFTGFLGSFTTFSTFGWNTLDLLRTGHAGLALLNILASVCLGLVGVWGGWYMGTR